MKRRGVLIGGLAGAGVTGLGGGLAGSMFRWHATPRRHPFLDAAHLRDLRDLPRASGRVLFVGNSLTFMHDIPARVAQAAATQDVSVQVAMAAAHGARLVETWRIGAVRSVLRAGWDVLVLQGFSTMVLRAPDRWGAAHAMRAMAREAGAGAVLLYPTWAFPETHPVYHGGGGFLAASPRSREDFAHRITTFYTDIARRQGWTRAPVTEALHENISVYTGPDGHHLNAAGAELVSAVLWQSLRGLPGIS